jgi:hypothetical protein
MPVLLFMGFMSFGAAIIAGLLALGDVIAGDLEQMRIDRSMREFRNKYDIH